MILDIIKYNKKLIKVGKNIFQLGSVVLLINYFLGLSEFLTMLIFGITMMVMLIGLILINYSENRIEKIGVIIFKGINILIIQAEKEFVLDSQSIQINLIDPEYEGQNN